MSEITATQFLCQYRHEHNKAFAIALADTQRLWDAEIERSNAFDLKCHRLEAHNKALVTLVREIYDVDSLSDRMRDAWDIRARALLKEAGSE